MLTRLEVSGFKNLVDVSIDFGPITCIAGANGVGKSNVFDAIAFLSSLASESLHHAAAAVRSDSPLSGDVRDLFHRVGPHRASSMRFAAEMLIPRKGVDDLGQGASATHTFLRYVIELAYREVGLDSHEGPLEILHEELRYIKISEAHERLPFGPSRAWRRSVVAGRRTSPFISTGRNDDGKAVIYLHQDYGGDSKGMSGGRPRELLASRLPRTVVSTVQASDSPTVVLARREMQSWRMLQLEPTALRSPDPFTAPRRLSSTGAHMPSTLGRLARVRLRGGDLFAGSASEAEIGHAEAVYARVTNRLLELISDVSGLRVDVDERKDLMTLVLKDRTGTSFEAKDLSDGTLRFLALSILAEDPDEVGVLCLEEPENGIHPARVPAILSLLGDLAVDPDIEAGLDNPLRQVILNTHSPLVVRSLPRDALLFADSIPARENGIRHGRAVFRGLADTWRVRDGAPEAVSLGKVLEYLGGALDVGPFVPSSRKYVPTVREHVQRLLEVQLELGLEGPG